MIFLITALPYEAKTLIKKLSLKRVTDIHAFPVYQDEDRTYTLAISGPGKAAAAAAVGCISTAFAAGSGDILVNIGCAAVLSEGDGDDVGKIFLCSKITDSASQRTFYPDMLIRSELAEAEIITVDRIIEAEDKVQDLQGNSLSKIPVLADMEASAVWEAGMHFFAPHRILFIKIISDAGDGCSVTAKAVETLIWAALPSVDAILKRALQFEEMPGTEAVPANDHEAALLQLAEDLHASETMRIQLEQLLRYGSLAGTDTGGLVQAYYQAGKLPCKDRREGKQILEQIRRSLL